MSLDHVEKVADNTNGHHAAAAAASAESQVGAKEIQQMKPDSGSADKHLPKCDFTHGESPTTQQMIDCLKPRK